MAPHHTRRQLNREVISRLTGLPGQDLVHYCDADEVGARV